jgi:hypothetical protein
MGTESGEYSFTPITQTQVRKYMRKYHPGVLEKERERVRRYRNYSAPVVAQFEHKKCFPARSVWAQACLVGEQSAPVQFLARKFT